MTRLRIPQRASALKPVGDLEHQHVVRRSLERAADVLSEVETSGVREIFTLLSPDEVHRRAGPPLPSEDGVESEGLEIEVGIVELEVGALNSS